MSRRRTPRKLRQAIAQGHLAIDTAGRVYRVKKPEERTTRVVEVRPNLLAPDQQTAGLTCAHGKPIHQCALCSKEGEQYELDRQVEELAGGVLPEEWLARARKFQKAEAALRLSLGRNHTETRQARDAARQCTDLAKALLEAQKTRNPSPGAAPHDA